MIRVVLDTNEYVSALIQPIGVPAKILQMWRKGKIFLITSPLIRDEIQRVLYYPRIRNKYNLNEKDIDDFLHLLALETFSTHDNIRVNVVKEDFSDNKFIACALEGRADYLVSSDRHLLLYNGYHGLKILNPREFLLELKEQIK